MGNTPSKSDETFQRLLEKITTLEFAPGQRLSEAHLMQTLEVGRTPIREALQRLAAVGLVQIERHQSNIVTPLQPFDVGRIVEMRMILETNAARLAAERATPAELERIAAASHAYDALNPATPPAERLAQDSAFHDEIASASHNEHLASAITTNRLFGARLWYLTSRNSGYDQKYIEYSHEPIVEAIRSRDPDRAEAEMRHHVDIFRKTLKRSEF